MVKFFYMMRLFITLVLIALSLSPVNSAVVNADLEEIVQIGLEKNQNIKIKRLELEASKKDIKIANRLQNPEIQSNVVIGNVLYPDLYTSNTSDLTLKFKPILGVISVKTNDDAKNLYSYVLQLFEEKAIKLEVEELKVKRLQVTESKEAKDKTMKTNKQKKKMTK